VGLFRRKPELDQLRARRTLLEKQLVTAGRELAAAIEARQQALLEGDPDTPLDGQSASGLVGRLHDEKAAVVTAISTIDQRIAEAESKLATERDLAMREAAGKELTAAVDQLDRVAADLASIVARIPATLADVLGRLPPPHSVLPERIQAFANGLIDALQTELGEARAYSMRLTAGDAALVTPRPDDVKTAPVPIVERQEVFLLAPSRWTEPNGEVLTGGPHATCSPPAAIAARALEFGHALDPLSDFAIMLRQRIPPNYGYFSPQDCVDINEPKSTKPPGGPTAAAPMYSEFVGRPRVGTAIARI
jgi:hypothetical protein